MKKIISAVALILCIVLSCCFAVACSPDYGNEIENLKNQIGELENSNNTLKNELEEVKNENNSLKDELEEIKNSKDNVFWTEKQEYSQNETMTVYYGNIAVLKVKLSEYSPNTALNIDFVNCNFGITSLVADIYAGDMVKTTYLEYDGKIAINGSSYDSSNSTAYICYKNIENFIGASYDCVLSDDVINATDVKIVVCVPGTPFPMAHFKITKITVR